MRRLSAALLAAAVLAGAGAAEALSQRRLFFVYFDWNRAELTPGGAALARTFAETHAVDPVSRIVVVGHADRSGEEPYNTELSLLRAETVAEELKRLGVDPAIVMVEAKGESEPAVPTPDGVPEPLNRRAEIVYLKCGRRGRRPQPQLRMPSMVLVVDLKRTLVVQFRRHGPRGGRGGSAAFTSSP